MPTMQAIAYYTFAVENEQGLFGNELMRQSPGYVDAEATRLIKKRRSQRT
jgi:hypothetical protein